MLVTAEDDVEGEGAARFGEEHLGAGLAAQPSLEHVGTKAVGRERAWEPLAREELRRRAARAVLEEHDQHVAQAKVFHRAAAEVADIRRKGDSRQVNDRVRGRPGRCGRTTIGGRGFILLRPPEDSSVPAGRQVHREAMTGQLSHEAL